MVYSRFGCELTITAFCGYHTIGGPRNLNRVFLDALVQATRHYFVHTLRADGGAVEIRDLVDSVPQVVLTASEMVSALEQAE